MTDAVEQIDRLQLNGRSVAPVRFHNEVAWILLGYDAVAAAFLNESGLPAADFYERFTSPWLGRTVPSMRGQEHSAHRAFFLAPFLPTRVRAYSERAITPIANELISGFGAEREIDFVAAYAKQYPFRVITRLLDLPQADNEIIHKFVSELFHFPWDPDGAARARDAMTEYLRPIARARRRNPSDDIISYFASTEVNGRLLDESDLIDFVRFIYPAAGENTTNALGLLMYWALNNKEVHERVLRNPADRAAAVEEMLRIDPPVPLIVRYTEKAISIAGADIPARSSILLAIAAANRDAKYFDEPATFSLDRGMNRHIAFGRGPHFCIGAHLARLELRTTLDLMLSRLPGLRLVKDQRTVFEGGLMRGPVSLPVTFADILAC
jgi:cytochrome P450